MAEVVDSRYVKLVQKNVRGNGSWFLTRTNKEHRESMAHPFMKTIYAKNFDREAYTAYLTSQYIIFKEFERVCDVHRHSAPISALYDEALLRSAGLEQDLSVWGGDIWRERTSSPSPQTVAYLEQLRADSQDPWLLLCHHFLHYNFVLSGSQFFGSVVSGRARDQLGATGADSLLGAAFYQFPDHCQPTHVRVQQYIETFDQLEIPESVRDRMLECMRRVYAILLGMFDEAYAIAPLEGVSYNDGKESVAAGAGNGGKGKKGPPPPPLVPASRKFTLAELQRQHAGASPILTSILGRVYDVSAAKNFFGKGGPYEMFSGHDGTYNLAVMQLKKKTLDVFEYELDDEEKVSLADWIAYFDHNYGQPVGVLVDVQQSVTLNDLPRATKIPFSEEEDEEDVQSSNMSSGVASAAPASKL